MSEIVKCIQCETEFLRKSPVQIFCGPNCRKLSTAERYKTEESEKDCVICGSKFKTNFKNKICCSVPCSIKRKRKQRGLPDKEENIGKTNCKNCRNEFEKYHPLQLYCTPECQGRKTKGEKKVVTCQICKNEFLQQRINQKTCSRECSVKNQMSYLLNSKIGNLFDKMNYFEDLEGY